MVGRAEVTAATPLSSRVAPCWGGCWPASGWGWRGRRSSASASPATSSRSRAACRTGSCWWTWPRGTRRPPSPPPRGRGRGRAAAQCGLAPCWPGWRHLECLPKHGGVDIMISPSNKASKLVTSHILLASKVTPPEVGAGGWQVPDNNNHQDYLLISSNIFILQLSHALWWSLRPNSLTIQNFCHSCKSTRELWRHPPNFSDTHKT